MRSHLSFDTSTLLIRPRGALVLGALMYLAAGLHTVLLQNIGWPSTEVLWFAMLVPTIILSFYYGRLGALTSVLIAAVLFMAVEVFTHDAAFWSERALFGASVLLAIVSLAIGIGELAELLRKEYVRRVCAERLAATSELAVALRHEIFNPLSALVAEVELLQEDAGDLPQEAGESLSNLAQLASRIHELVDRIAEIEDPERVEYLEGTWMADLSSSEPVGQ